MTDNGAAMLASETTTGLARLSILHQTTLPYSPYQNAKQEVFWARVESRQMAMLEGQEQLSDQSRALDGVGTAAGLTARTLQKRLIYLYFVEMADTTHGPTDFRNPVWARPTGDESKVTLRGVMSIEV